MLGGSRADARDVDRSARPRAVRLLIAFALVVGGLAAGVSLYVGAIQAGLIRNPLGPVVRGDLAGARSERPGLRVLFVGNSLTYYNDMPGLVQKLAAGDPGARPLFAVYYTAPGWSLRSASRDGGLADLLHEVDWDVLVLQEHSTRAAAPEESLRRDTVPFARDLQDRATAGGARTVVFMNWFAREPEATDLGIELAASVAPAALAWDEALRGRPGLDLLGSDGAHPNLAGSYLIACVFYATLTGRDPTASSFTAGLTRSDARYLQRAAANVARR
jgi:hypothetical protein